MMDFVTPDDTSRIFGAVATTQTMILVNRFLSGWRRVCNIA